jgi:hypothetical protein
MMTPEDVDDMGEPFVGYAVYGRTWPFEVVWYSGELEPPTPIWGLVDQVTRVVASTTTLAGAVAVLRILGASEARDMTTGTNWDAWGVLRPLDEIGRPRA